jgi:hypothetical protein
MVFHDKFLYWLMLTFSSNFSLRLKLFFFIMNNLQKKIGINICIILLAYFIAYKEFNDILLVVYSIFKFQK